MLHFGSRVRTIALAATVVASGALASGPSLAGMTVIELFTSQGCSSCPPADAYLSTIADDADVLALSLPVDYWDYLGWKDSLASPKHTARQRAYAEARGDRAVYTPQIVVNGVSHVVGSDRPAVEAAMRAAPQLGVDLSVEKTSETYMVTLPEVADSVMAKGRIWVVGYTREEPVSIGRGENAGRTIAYHNVVRKMIDLGPWDGSARTIEIDRGSVMVGKISDCAVIIQKDVLDGTGPIIAAARLENAS